MRVLWSYDDRNRSVLIASALMFMFHSVVYIVWAKFCLSTSVISTCIERYIMAFLYFFFTKDELRRAKTKSINHVADIKWRANEISTHDEDKPTPCFILRDKKESRDSSIIPDWCPLGWAMRSIIRNSFRRITSISL